MDELSGAFELLNMDPSDEEIEMLLTIYDADGSVSQLKYTTQTACLSAVLLLLAFSGGSYHSERLLRFAW